MSDWQELPLGEICGIEIGGTPSRSEERYWWKSDDDGIRLPWVSISDMKEKVITETKESITEVGALQSNCKHVEKGTLLMSFKLTIGRLAFAGKDLYTNEAITAIRPNKDIYPEFLYYGLQHWDLTGDSDQAVKGVTLNKQKLQEIPCLIPPLPEQKKIAEVLSGIDKQIFAYERQLEKNQRLSKGVLSGILARFEEESRDSTRLVEDIFFETSTPETHNSETPLYSLTIEFGLVPKPDRYVRDFLLTDKEKENYKLITKGDFVMNPMNLRWGAISAFHNESSAKISRYYTTFRARDDRTSVRFYEFLFCSDQYLRLYERIATGSLIEKMRVHWSAFKKLEIPFPSLEEQNNFESLSSSLELTSSRTKDLIAKLKIFRSAVASDLLSGRKRVSI